MTTQTPDNADRDELHIRQMLIQFHNDCINEPDINPMLSKCGSAIEAHYQRKYAAELVAARLQGKLEAYENDLRWFQSYGDSPVLSPVVAIMNAITDIKTELQAQARKAES